MSPRAIGRIATLLAIAWCIAAHAGARPTCTRADWYQLRQRQLFEQCRDARREERRECERSYADFVSIHFKTRRERGGV